MDNLRRMALSIGIGAAALAASAPAVDAGSVDAPCDAAVAGRTIAAARQARQAGERDTAERLCRTAFDAIDRSALAAFDAYADRLHAEHRAEEASVRAQSEKLHAAKAEQGRGTQPTSTYLGFAPAEGLTGYADLLSSLHDDAESQRMRSLALAYQQVQQAHFQRTQMFRQGQDPRGAC